MTNSLIRPYQAPSVSYNDYCLNLQILVSTDGGNSNSNIIKACSTYLTIQNPRASRKNPKFSKVVIPRLAKPATKRNNSNKEPPRLSKFTKIQPEHSLRV